MDSRLVALDSALKLNLMTRLCEAESSIPRNSVKPNLVSQRVMRSAAGENGFEGEERVDDLHPRVRLPRVWCFLISEAPLQRLFGRGGAGRGRCLSAPTEDPMWGHPMPVLGALSPFLEPFRGHLSPKADEIFQK